MVYWLPKTSMGKRALWLGITGLLVIILLNVVGELAVCGKCPEGYLREGTVCNPACYYETPQCLMPAIPSGCEMEIVDNIIWRIFNVVIGLAAMASILTSGVLSIIAIIKKKERALLAFIPLLLGLVGLFFLIGELLFEH